MSSLRCQSGRVAFRVEHAWLAQIVLKSVHYFEGGLTAFDAFHAATAETRGHSILGSDKAFESVDPDRVPLEPDDEPQ